jgi:hypothetical protein
LSLFISVLLSSELGFDRNRDDQKRGASTFVRGFEDTPHLSGHNI